MRNKQNNKLTGYTIPRAKIGIKKTNEGDGKLYLVTRYGKWKLIKGDIDIFFLN